MEKKIKSKCVCGMKIRGSRHYDGPHHKAWEDRIDNASRKCGKK